MATVTPGLNTLLELFDHYQEQQWRVEDRTWRKDEVAYRSYSYDIQEHDTQHRDEKEGWRKDDLEQFDLDNVQYLWDEFVLRTRVEVSLKSEQLKALAFIAAILAGFSMTSFNQFNFEAKQFSDFVNITYGITTALSVGLAMNSMVLSTLIQASMLKVHLQYISAAEEAAFYLRCYRFLERYQFGHAPPHPGKNFNKFWKDQCEGSFQRAFLMFSLAVPSFVVNLGIAVWIVFPFSHRTAYSINLILGIMLLLYVTSHTRWLTHVLGVSTRRKAASDRFKPRGLPFDWHLANPYFARYHSTLSSSMSG